MRAYVCVCVCERQAGGGVPVHDASIYLLQYASSLDLLSVLAPCACVRSGTKYNLSQVNAISTSRLTYSASP